MSTRDMDNPFYRNYLFFTADLSRIRIKWYHYFLLLFRPMYCQLTPEGYSVHFKTTADGRIFIFKMTKDF